VKFHCSYLVCLLLAINIAACSSPTPTVEPELPSLPTAQVPPISEIDAAFELWKTSNLNHYFAESEIRNQEGLWKIRVLVTDDLIRSAQYVELDGDGQWGEPVSIPRDEAQEYTVESVFERLRDDVLGEGSVPLNMKIIFDQELGYPISVNAEALPTYNDAGQVVVDSQQGYDLQMDVKPLLENTYGANQEPIYSLTRGGGPEAWCDTLRILQDNTSIYTDDCRNEFLRLPVPETFLARLDELKSSITSIDEVRVNGEQFERLIIDGTGEEIPDDLTIESAWDLSAELLDFLSQRIGLGIVLSYLYNGDLYGFDLFNKISLPSQMPISGGLLGVRHTLDGILMAISDEDGLSVLNTQSQQRSHFLAPLESGYYIPRELSLTDRLLISSVSENVSDLIQHGWVSLSDQTSHELPIPEGVSGYGCDTGAAWSPDASKIAISGLGYGDPCSTTPGLSVVDLSRGTARTIVSPIIDIGEGDESTIVAGAYTPTWSPDGSWIAFGLDQDATEEFVFPTRLYQVRPDGANLISLTSNMLGKATHPVWAGDNSLYYGLSGEGEEQDGLYQYRPGENTHVLLLPGSGIHPVSISPGGEFLLYEQDQMLKIWQIRLGDTVAEIRGDEDNQPIFVGWLLTENDR
jgi:hypothetical protein